MTACKKKQIKKSESNPKIYKIGVYSKNAKNVKNEDVN
jgi:hypothetical protein